MNHSKFALTGEVFPKARDPFSGLKTTSRLYVAMICNLSQLACRLQKRRRYNRVTFSKKPFRPEDAPKCALGCGFVRSGQFEPCSGRPSAFEAGPSEQAGGSSEDDGAV